MYTTIVCTETVPKLMCDQLFLKCSVYKVKEKEVAELKEQNLYYSPADEESAIYEQLDTQGIRIIRTKDIK